ncbi:hypothetical protein ILUMI_24298 [Ignelater luminosus]|uniref:PDZ domain-containing protein n=1 Tax=Ignelater luminosus TaxID=2038154 RepID=A0A8K0G0S6_IGNLU|nr:hypothetical protein ILUMI_24298 [Ignelater luminosus]
MSWCKCLSCPKTEVEDITTLDFSCCSLTEVPPIVFNFERTLQYLHLDCNKIIELPRTLFQCEELRYLGLSDNEIETIPPLIEKLSNLENLLLNRNCLAYESIPSNIHRCQRLRILHLSSNSLTKVPGSITRLVCLRELYLNNCDLEFLPANFGRLNNLRILELRENHLASLPKSLKRLSDLRRLDISSNMFKKFPEVIGTMTNLTELWLNDNFISDIPDCVGSLHKLTHFDVSCNRLEKVTNNIGLCTNITLLLLSMNDLKELPRTIGNLLLLHTLKVDHNLLETLPQNIGKLSNLEELDVQFNNLKSFPNSIGMLRKLNSLVAAQNSISHLPTEIGSCTALSVLSLHYNVLMYLPEEIGHLQNLTSISLINNRLRYLPITILSLRKLKALWLSHNQSQPLITLQKEALESGQVVLTCVFLPQVEMPLHIPPAVQTVVPSGRRINFSEPSVSNNLPARLTRIPTPHPKAFVKYQRTLESTLRRNQESVSQNISVDAIYVKEANIVPMKNAAEENEVSEDVPVQNDENHEDIKYQNPMELSTNKNPSEELINTQYDIAQNYDLNDGNNNGSNINETPSECVVSIGSERTCSPIQNGIENLQINDHHSEAIYSYTAKCVNTIDRESGYVDSSPQLQPQLSSGAKPKQPPPYHIAAVYSRGAHLFLNSAEKAEKESEPKHFTQDQPVNILNPQPKHARCMTQLPCENAYSYNDNDEMKTTNASYNNNDDLIQIEKVLFISSGLLKANIEDDQHKYLVDQFLQFENSNFENRNVPRTLCSILNTKLQILKTAEYLLFYREHVHLHKNYIMPILDNLQRNLDILPGRLLTPFVYPNAIDTETREKLTLIDIATILLEASYKNQEYYDLISQIVHIEKILPQDYLLENITNIKPKTEKEAMIQAKLQLIKIIVYFLSINSNDKEYKYIFGKFMQLHRRLQYILLKSQQKPLYNGNSLLEIPDQRNLPSHVELKNGIVKENKPMNNGKGNMNWVFGAHRNPKIIKVELTPCCYVLGFSVSHSEEGVFIDEVDKNGNAFQKLFTGDKILMLDDRDISKMDPEDALKAVQVWGPETETFLISRN